MKNSSIVIIGAGPSGLSCALELARHGYEITLIEKGNSVGGLMRSISRNDYTVDLGRKELYTRIASVNKFWGDLLGTEYIEYDHHEGYLYEGRILEKSTAYKGPFRGIPFFLIFKILFDLIKWKFKFAKPKNYEELASKSRGQLFNKIFNQGYFEKFNGKKWSELPLPANGSKKRQKLKLTSFLKKIFVEIFDKATQQEKCRHPRFGAGQITKLIKADLDQYPIKYLFGSTVKSVVLEENEIKSIIVDSEDKSLTLTPAIIISSIPINIAGKTFLDITYPNQVNRSSLHRGVILVYLFINEPSTFPHTWLNVSDPNMKVGRIVNFGNFNGEMVPKKKTCLCLEYFLFSDDPLFKLSNLELKDMAIKEVSSFNLFNPDKIEDFMVLNLPYTNASESWKDFIDESFKVELFEKLKSIKNLYNVSRIGTDRATHAGLEAAKAIINNNKDPFEFNTDPMLKEPWNRE
ncbi:MAG: protoporphyrinogen oxidase [Saprospiraceae bacterium]|jgi:protoporphyrinogen oxidase